MQSNFNFLKARSPQRTILGMLAVKYFFHDPTVEGRRKQLELQS